MGRKAVVIVLDGLGTGKVTDAVDHGRTDAYERENEKRHACGDDLRGDGPHPRARTAAVGLG